MPRIRTTSGVIDPSAPAEFSIHVAGPDHVQILVRNQGVAHVVECTADEMIGFGVTGIGAAHEATLLMQEKTDRGARTREAIAPGGGVISLDEVRRKT